MLATWSCAYRKTTSFFEFDFQQGQTVAAGINHTNYPVITSSTNASKVGEIACNWYRTCPDTHGSCRRTAAIGNHAVQVQRYRQPRLLRVENKVVRLISGNRVAEKEEDAVLGHCWGRDVFLTLTKSNIKTFEEQGIEEKDLAVNSRNFWWVCRWLSSRHLSIDSLCIIQSGDYRDWMNHVELMGTIYANSDVCIAIAATSGATQCSFVDRNPDYIHFKVSVCEPMAYILQLFKSRHIYLSGRSYDLGAPRCASGHQGLGTAGTLVVLSQSYARTPTASGNATLPITRILAIPFLVGSAIKMLASKSSQIAVPNRRHN